MVVVVAVCAANVQGHFGGLREALQPMGDHLGAQVADLLAAEAQVDDGPRTAREVDHSPREGLVERGIAAAEAGEGLAGTEGFCERRAEGEEGILRGVVIVD